jgi:hypothetical protein
MIQVSEELYDSDQQPEYIASAGLGHEGGRIEKMVARPPLTRFW